MRAGESWTTECVCDKHGRGGAKCWPASFSEWSVQRGGEKRRCTCGLYRHDSFSQTKRGNLGRFPPLCADDTVCCASAAAAAVWLSMLGSLRAMMKWKSSSAVNTCMQTVIERRHCRTLHNMLSFPFHKDINAKVWLCLLMFVQHNSKMRSCSVTVKGGKDQTVFCFPPIPIERSL